MKSRFFSLLVTAVLVVSLPYLCRGADLSILKLCKEKTLAAAALLKSEGESGFAKIRDPAGSFRYANGEGYIWVHNLEGIMVMHPIKPVLEGENVLEMRDVNGVYLFEAFNAIAVQSGQGWVPYAWRKPGERGSSPKVSFVVLIENSGKKYVVGSGMYDFTADDVKAVFPADAIYEEE